MHKFVTSKFTLGITLLSGLLLSLCLLQADTKVSASIDWLDVATEGALLLLGLSWLALVLQARPGGKVTQLLIFGLLGYSLGCYMDLLDEFFVNHSLPSWFAFLEKLPTPIGLLTLTCGLWLWREEQITINEQLRTREQFFRQHKLVDRVTKIYDARAMRQQIALNRNHPLSLIMIDIDNFSEINQRDGFNQGDKLLTNIAQMLTCQLRSQDLVCRFAGDRFIILLPNCSAPFSQAMAAELQRAIAHLGCQASSAYIHYDPHAEQRPVDVDSLISQINKEMERVKQARPWPQAV
ncbi:GGDEF domain-containing protein [Shewanella abyssi]|uniref:GGDEF domain-containing protein n=1 Tax=Shewanella abyssi TaxID=311789 RepID=UPI00200FD44C|nr:diguanylate cyclase [Shewanella abyssi]MCL1051736.1 GGDEF domain-containing protein [Shewanella abyssi]